jgi:anthranilate phosphoribosyltransferase
MTAVDDVVVRGTATNEEIAAVLAALHTREPQPSTVSAYERWRRGRIAALRGYSRAR